MGYDLARIAEQTQNAIDALANAQREVEELRSMLSVAGRSPAEEERIHLAGFECVWQADSHLLGIQEDFASALKRWQRMERRRT